MRLRSVEEMAAFSRATEELKIFLEISDIRAAAQDKEELVCVIEGPDPGPMTNEEADKHPWARDVLRILEDHGLTYVETETVH